MQINIHQPLFEENFEFFPCYIDDLEEIAQKAWNNPDKINESDYIYLRDLSKIANFEVALWFRYELLSRTERQYEIDNKEELMRFVRKVRNEKIIYESQSLKDLSVSIVDDSLMRNWNNNWKKSCSSAKRNITSQIFGLVKQLVDLFYDDCWLIFNLTSRFSSGIYEILSASPLVYGRLINELYVLRNEQSWFSPKLVVKLKEILNQWQVTAKNNHLEWWTGSLEAWRIFITDCLEAGLIVKNDSGKSEDISATYRIKKSCQLNFCVKLLYTQDNIKKLYPNDARSKDTGGEITNKELITLVNKTFNSTITEATFSKAKCKYNEEMEEQKKETPENIKGGKSFKTHTATSSGKKPGNSVEFLPLRKKEKINMNFIFC